MDKSIQIKQKNNENSFDNLYPKSSGEKFLSKYFWRRWKHQINYTEIHTPLTGTRLIVAGGSSGYTSSYSKEISYDGSNITLSEPIMQTLSEYETAAAPLVDYAPCYVKLGYNQSIYYLPERTTYSRTSYNHSTLAVYSMPNQGNCLVLEVDDYASPYTACYVSFKTEESDYDIETISSDNRHEYPDSGTLGEYNYEYLRRPFERLPLMPIFKTGAYDGDGKQERFIEVGFTPKAVLVVQRDGLIYHSGSDSCGYGGLAITGFPSYVGDNNYTATTVSIVEDGFKVYYYKSSRSYAYTNMAESRYHYFAIG